MISLLFFFLLGSIQFQFQFQSTSATHRILHEPLFPANDVTPFPTPPPVPPTTASDTSDQPFFPEIPNGATAQSQSQTLTPPPPPPQPATFPVATQPVKPAKEAAIAASVGIVTMGMVSALAFYIYRHKAKHTHNTPKLINSDSNSHSYDDDSSSRNPPTSFFYAVDSSNTRSDDSAVANSSPYHKLNSIKKQDRYRPSPDLQPLPPLTRHPVFPQSPAPVFRTSPSAATVSSSEDEGRDNAFYTPYGSGSSYGDGFASPVSKQSRRSRNGGGFLPFSKASSSPKPRVLPSSPEFVKHAIIPSIKAAPPPPPPPPPPASMKPLPPEKKIGSLANKIPRPPPPPPPPPPQIQAIISNKVEAIEKFAEVRECVETEVDSSKPKQIEEGDEMVKLKPLHWDKVKASSDRATVWDQLKSSSFQLNEDMIESLFGCNSNNQSSVANKDATRRSVLPPVEQENRVLDPKKSQNIAILLRALNVSRDEVSEALREGNPEALGAELLETLVKMAPTKEEEIKLKGYKGDTTKLGTAEKFLIAILDIPFAFRRVEAMLYRANFDSEVKYLRKSYDTLETASSELKSSRLFLKLLEAVLRTGNRMNVGTNRGDAKAFKLDTLLKLADIKGTDGKTTLLHFVVQEIIRSEGIASETNSKGLQTVSGLSRELGSVKLAAGMDSDVLHGYVLKLETGLEKVRAGVQHERPEMEGGYLESMRGFLKEAEEEISRIKDGERRALGVVREVTEYFHGNAAKEEAHPFRIFMIVRDFLSALDLVCKEVGRTHSKTMIGPARSFRLSTNAPLPVLNRYNANQGDSSSEENSSP